MSESYETDLRPLRCSPSNPALSRPDTMTMWSSALQDCPLRELITLVLPCITIEFPRNFKSANPEAVVLSCNKQETCHHWHAIVMPPHRRHCLSHFTGGRWATRNCCASGPYAIFGPTCRAASSLTEHALPPSWASRGRVFIPQSEY